MTLPTVEPSPSVTPRVRSLTAGRTPPAAEGPITSDIFYGAADPKRFRIWQPLSRILLLSGRIADGQPESQHNRELQAHGALRGHPLQRSGQRSRYEQQ